MVQLLHGDCLEEMDAIPDGSVDAVIAKKQIVWLYDTKRWTLRMIAERFSTDHHRIKRILEREGVKITKRKTLKPYTQEHRDAVGRASKGRKAANKGKKSSKISLYKNMRGHLKYAVSLEWLMQFEDIEKLKFLNRSIGRPRDSKDFDTGTYKKFITRFYYDRKFNDLFEKWVLTGDKWIKPSLDHINAKSNGGSLLLDNLQYISWLENRAKANIDQAEWDLMKARIHDYL